MRSLVLQSLKSPKLAKTATTLYWKATGFALATTGNSENKMALLTYVDKFLRSVFVYAEEIIETLQTPDYMLSGFEMSGRLIGDCDDISTLHSALLTALGFQVRFVAIRSMRENSNYDHVYIEVKHNDSWIMYDVTLPLGTEVHYFGRVEIKV